MVKERTENKLCDGVLLWGSCDNRPYQKEGEELYDGDRMIDALCGGRTHHTKNPVPRKMNKQINITSRIIISVLRKTRGWLGKTLWIILIHLSFPWSCPLLYYLIVICIGHNRKINWLYFLFRRRAPLLRGLFYNCLVFFFLLFFFLFTRTPKRGEVKKKKRLKQKHYIPSLDSRKSLTMSNSPI